MKPVSFLVALGLLSIVGCGGGEDFSSPPAALQNRPAVTSDESTAAPTFVPAQESTPADPSAATAETNTATDQAAVAASPDTADQTPAAITSAEGETSAATPSADGTAAASSTLASTAGSTTSEGATASMPQPSATPTGPEASAKPAGSPVPDPVANSNANATPATNDSEVMTASGKTPEQIAAKKEANSKKGVMGNLGGIMDSLKGKVAPSPGQPVGGVDVAQQVTRFGRLALSRADWLNLVTRLSRRFFVASTPDASRILASAGERHAEVVTTQIERLFDRVAVSRGEATSPVMQPIHGLKGIINSLELTTDGNLAIFGTTDGRLLARSAASTRNWDLFARDLFLYQDQYRTVSKLSDAPIVAVRILPNGKLLTIDGDGLCSFWMFNEAIHDVTPVTQIKIEQAKSADAQTVTAKSSKTFALEGFQVLSISVANSGSLGAIVSSDEKVTLFSIETGEVIDTLQPEQFADALPVCVEFLPERREVLVGLGDGRIMRRAFGDGAPVSSTDEAGAPIDYEVVYLPGVQDATDPLTCLALVPNTTTLYFGTSAGNVCRYDLNQKQIEHVAKRHEGAVLELRVTSTGIVSVGEDRQAALFDVPLSPLNQDPSITRVFALPKDETLKEEVVENPETVVTVSKSSRPVRRLPAPPVNEIDLSLSGIRPIDPAMALFEHQLRTTPEADKQLEIRKDILRHSGRNSLAETLGSIDTATATSPPLQVFEINTEYLYGAEHQANWTRVKLAISDDGMTVVSLRRSSSDRSESITKENALEVRDLATGTTLRRWTQPGMIRNFQVVANHHAIFPTGPNINRLSTLDGSYAEDTNRTYLTCTTSPDKRLAIYGHMGQSGVAANSLTRVNLADGETKSGLELYESLVSAVAFSNSGESLYVSTRGREQTRLLEVDPLTLSIRHEINKEPLPGVMSTDPYEAILQPGGDTMLLPSHSNNLLMTWATHSDGLQMRFWRRSKNGWPKENVVVIKEESLAPERDADRSATFVGTQDSLFVAVTTTGLTAINTKKARVEGKIPIPSVGSHRPPCYFSPDNNWVLTGDGEGNIWALALKRLNGQPRKFAAHPGPISGIAMSANGRYLVTSGEDNHIRSWRIDGFLGETQK